MSGAAVAGGLTVRAVDPFADARWDAFVTAHADGVVFHHSAWLRTLAGEYGQAPVALAAEDEGGKLHGVLPLVATRGLPLVPRRVGGARLSSLPRTPVAGPLADDDAALALLARAAIERLPPRAELQLKPTDERLTGLVPGLIGSPWRETYVIDLPERPDDLRFGNSRNHSRIRWAVNKARKQGVTVREATGRADIRRWHRLYLSTMRHHMVPPRPERLFHAMWEHLRPHAMMRLLLAERDGRLLAGSVVLQLGRSAFYAFNGVDRGMLSLRPNEVLQWHAIHDACAAGCRQYDMGEVVERHEGLADFKRKWGTTAVRLHRFHAPATEATPSPPDTGPGRAGRLALRAWQRVPLPLTAVTGERVYRYL